MFTGRCVSVHDGDTLTVLTVGNLQVKVRLYGIDSPELKQAFGNNAKRCASDLAFDKFVTVHGKGLDRYGRVIGWVFVRDTCVNKELVSRGFAWWYRQYAPGVKLFEDAEKYAKKAKLGLWSQPSPQAPWDWRKAH